MKTQIKSASAGDTNPSARRGFLRGLIGLPLIGGSITLIGSPTRADVLVTDELLHTYDTFLETERRFLNWERANGDRKLFEGLMDCVYLQNPAGSFDYVGDRGGVAPSARAAVVLSAVGYGWGTRRRNQA